MTTWEQVCQANWALEEHMNVCRLCEYHEPCSRVAFLIKRAEDTRQRWNDQLQARYR